MYGVPLFLNLFPIVIASCFRLSVSIFFDTNLGFYFVLVSILLGAIHLLELKIMLD